MSDRAETGSGPPFEEIVAQFDPVRAPFGGVSCGFYRVEANFDAYVISHKKLLSIFIFSTIYNLFLQFMTTGQ